MRRHDLKAVLSRMKERAGSQLQQRRERLTRSAALLRVLSPDSILNRGYSITMSEAGELIQSTAQTQVGMKLATRLKDGQVESIVL